MTRIVWQDSRHGITVRVADAGGLELIAKLRYDWCSLRRQGIGDTGVGYEHRKCRVTQLFDDFAETTHLIAETASGEPVGIVRIVRDTDLGLPMENRSDWARLGKPGYSLTRFRGRRRIRPGDAQEVGMLVVAPSAGGGGKTGAI